MADLKWLDKYSGESTEELISLEGKYRTDSLVVAFEQALEQKIERLGEESLTREEHVILVIEALEREVNNGGFELLFINSSKRYASLFTEALELIGCTETANLTRQAIDILGIREPISVEAIDRVMEQENEEREKKLGECDDRYYQIAGDLSIPLFEFIKKNRDKITLKD